MKAEAIVTSVKNAACKAGFQLKKHSPEILIVAGVVGTVTSAVLACKATTKISDILEEAKNTIDVIHSYESNTEYSERYSHEDAKKDLLTTYVKTGVKLTKLYAPSVILGALSITSIVASNNILRKRNIALAAAYTAVDKSFKDYKIRVAERFGDEIEKEIRYGVKAEKLEETVVDPETGKEKKVKTPVNVVKDDAMPSAFARWFDERSPYYEKNSEYNLMFLRAQQNYANDKLRAQGFLFLNDVYDALGIPLSKAGQAVGWIYDPDSTKETDNYVDFGIYETYRQNNRDFVNGLERCILLDFNVDGVILEDFVRRQMECCY